MSYHLFAQFRHSNAWTHYSSSDDLDKERNHMNILCGYDAYHQAYKKFSIWEGNYTKDGRTISNENLKIIAKEIVENFL